MNTLKIAPQLRLILLSLLTMSLLSTGCTSLQQTTVAATDDLYSTPNKETPQDATAYNKKGNQYQGQMEGEEDGFQDYQTYPDDRYLRLKVANRNRWDAIDDFGYWNDPRYNYAYYPSYGGWNSWYDGFYGSSWFSPFGMGMGFGWGGYGPLMNSYYSLGWGFNDFGWGGFGGMGMGMGWGGFGGWGGWGGGGMGMGWGGFGGWHPFYGGMWNPYGYYYPGYFDGFAGGLYGRGIRNQNPAATRLSAPAMSAYRNTSNNKGYNNSFNNNTGNTRYTGNANLNNNFGSLLKRVVTNNNNTSVPNSWDRPVRRFNNNSQNNTAPTKTNSTNSYNNNSSTPSFNNNAGGRSGGFNSTGTSTGGGRAPRGQK